MTLHVQRILIVVIDNNYYVDGSSEKLNKGHIDPNYFTIANKDLSEYLSVVALPHKHTQE